MNDPSLSDQATTPDQSVVASEQAQPLTDTNVAGSAMLLNQTRIFTRLKSVNIRVN